MITSSFIHLQSYKMIMKKKKIIKILNSKAKNNYGNYMQLLEIFIKYVKMFIFSRPGTIKIEFNGPSSPINIFHIIEFYLYSTKFLRAVISKNQPK